MAAPAFTAAEARDRGTFLALMWAFSYPGRVHALAADSQNPFEAIGAVLLDLETSYFTPDTALDPLLRRTTARSSPIESAEYIFYPVLTDGDLETLSRASIGEMLFPDRAATLILGAEFGSGVRLTLSGPGIQASGTIAVGGLPANFWALRERTRRFPLGWDIFLVAGAQVIGLPRSTAIHLTPQPPLRPHGEGESDDATYPLVLPNERNPHET